MSLATLSIDLNAKLAKFEGDMGKAARASEATAARMNAAFGSAKATLAGVAAGISVAGIVAFARATIDSMDALNDLKDATGSTIENISALEDVAKRTGTSFDTVGTSLIKFNKLLGDAKPGSEAEAALKAIGLSAQELKAIDPAEALLKTATALAGFADDGNKARLTQELFGKSLKEVAPFLKDLAEQGKLNATVTTAQAEEAEKFNKSLFELQKNVLDASRSIVSNFVPSLVALSGELVVAIKTSNSFWDAIKAQLTTNPFKTASENADVYRESLARLALTRERFVKEGRDTSGIDNIMATDQRRLNYFNAVQLTNVPFNEADGNDALSRKSKIGARASINFTGATKPTKAKATSEAKDIDDTNKKLSQYVQSLQRATIATAELNEVEKANLFLTGEGSGANAAQRELILSMAEQIDKEKELTAAIKAKREASIADGLALEANNEQRQSILKNLLGDTASAALEKQRADVQLLTEELEAGRLSESLYLEAVTARLNLTGEKLTETKSLAEDLGLTFTSSFEDAILAGKDLQGVLNAIGQDIGKLILRKTITEPAGNYLSSLVTGSLGKLFSFDGGGYTGSGSRSGGADGKGGFLAMLHPNETVVDHTRGQGKSANVTYIFNGGVSRSEVMSGLQQVRAAAVGDVVDGQKRRRF